MDEELLLLVLLLLRVVVVVVGLSSGVGSQREMGAHHG